MSLKQFIVGLLPMAFLMGCALGHDDGELYDPRAGNDYRASPTAQPKAQFCGEREFPGGDTLIDPHCNPMAQSSLKAKVEWHSQLPGELQTSPVVANLTDDNADGVINALDIPDIVTVNRKGMLMVMSGNGSQLQWSFALPPAEEKAPEYLLPTPAIGDIDGDGLPEIVASSLTRLVALNHDGSILWTASLGYNPQLECGAYGIYDLNGDGSPEIVIGAMIFDGNTGKLVGNGHHGLGSGHPDGVAMIGVAADVLANGTQQVVVGNALYAHDGSTIWFNDQEDGFVGVANFDDDEQAEIVVAWNGNVRLQDDDGTVLWSGNYTGERIGPPTVSDLDGDGKPEIGVAGPDRYVVIETDGTLKWERKTQDTSSGFTGSSVFDFEGDGKTEIVYADETTLWVFDGATGAIKLESDHHSSATCSEYPTIVDVDGDGQVEIVYSHSKFESGQFVGLTVLGDVNQRWQPGRKIWNQHAFNLVNVNEDATIPTHPNTNWNSYNSFRSGDLSALTGGARVDAILQQRALCMDLCSKGWARIVMGVANRGSQEIPPGLAVSVYAEMADGSSYWLQSQQLEEAVGPGRSSDAIIFDIDLHALGSAKLVLRADNDQGVQALTECREDNNSVRIDQPLCNPS